MIPNFNHNFVIPPHLGNPTQPTDVSPYECDILSFCQKFATSKSRIEILKGFLNFRAKLASVKILNGFQWIDGSFTENVEARENRPPNDIDIVTFVNGVTQENVDLINSTFPECLDPLLSKTNFKVDHYLVDYGFSPDVTIELARYWVQLFSHNRFQVWKGILKVPLNSPGIDVQAFQYLDSL